ncbi:MAG: pantoate--beta-alanine ligase [Deltaproteobacteria bacterium]|nr:pantoate--beta-alanine ligase [Deltaproteobacteria bacterium]
MNPEVLAEARAVQARCAELRRAGKKLALVPTMGFLHEGHLSLMREGGERADVVAASIFVNPTQFGPNEDLSRYPRDLSGDLAKCGSAGVQFVYAPQPADVYPQGFQTHVEVTEVQKPLDGASRPGHFRGVATVVAKLFNIFRPDVALFGEKDFQQLRVLQRLNHDLNFGIDVVGMPIIREADGLAMSSRNSYLTADERQRALALSKGIFAARDACTKGERDVAKLLERVRVELRAADAREDYVQLVDSQSLEALTRVDGPARLLVAAFVGKTRLIDNVAIG